MAKTFFKKKIKCVLLLGASKDQIFIINTAHKMGLETAVIDAKKGVHDFFPIHHPGVKFV